MMVLWERAPLCPHSNQLRGLIPVQMASRSAHAGTGPKSLWERAYPPALVSPPAHASQLWETQAHAVCHPLLLPALMPQWDRAWHCSGAVALPLTLLPSVGRCEGAAAKFHQRRRSSAVPVPRLTLAAGCLSKPSVAAGALPALRAVLGHVGLVGALQVPLPERGPVVGSVEQLSRGRRCGMEVQPLAFQEQICN